MSSQSSRIPDDELVAETTLSGMDRSNLGNAIGNRSLLDCQIVGLICSIQCPGSIVIKTFDAIRELRDAGIVVAGGFHSPMESECLEFLLRGKQPVIVCLAKGLGHVQLPAAWKKSLDEGRLLLVSPFTDSVRRTTKAQAEIRNEFVVSLSAAVLVPHASPGGKTDTLARELIAKGKSIFTIDDPENELLISTGARRYHLEDIRRVFFASK